MKHSLRTRLLVIFALVSLAIVFSTVWLTRLAFSRGFVEYLDQQNIEVLENIAEGLADYYSSEGSWDNLRSNPLLWRQLVDARRGPVPQAFDPLRPEPFNPSDFQAGFPPLPEIENNPTGGLEANIRDVFLVDADGEWVGGRQQINSLTDQWPRVSISNGGLVVGTLFRSPVTEISEGLDRSFVNSQMRSSVVIAILTLAFALPLALYIASRLLAPVKSLAHGVEKLTSGDYDTNIEIQSRDELGQLARDLNLLSNTLRSNKTAQQRWISDISHELRTPVAILEGEIHAILDGIRQPNQKEMESLAAEVSRLTRLIDDLHQLSKSDAGDLSYHMAPVDIKHVLERSIQTFSKRMQDAGLESSLKIETDSTCVYGDESRLMQLFDNLLENACRYTDGPGQISLEVGSDKSNMIVTLSDSAPGVTDADLPQLFDRLYRVEKSRNRVSGGSGLGLAICRNIAQAHGATLEADHSDLGGVKMTCTLPLYDRNTGRSQ